MELEFGARHLNFSPHCCLFCSVTSMAAGMKKLKRACSDETLTSFCEPLGMDMISSLTLILDASDREVQSDFPEAKPLVFTFFMKLYNSENVL